MSGNVCPGGVCSDNGDQSLSKCSPDRKLLVTYDLMN